jgi:hypothetical protein
LYILPPFSSPFRRGRCGGRERQGETEGDREAKSKSTKETRGREEERKQGKGRKHEKCDHQKTFLLKYSNSPTSDVFTKT